MNISLRAYGFLSDQLKSKEWIELELENDTPVAEIVAMFGFDKKHIMTVLVNSNYTTFDSILKHGDKIEIIPFISGG